jgi:hypothetical protein
MEAGKGAGLNGAALFAWSNPARRFASSMFFRLLRYHVRYIDGGGAVSRTITVELDFSVLKKWPIRTFHYPLQRRLLDSRPPQCSRYCRD